MKILKETQTEFAVQDSDCMVSCMLHSGNRQFGASVLLRVDLQGMINISAKRVLINELGLLKKKLELMT